MSGMRLAVRGWKAAHFRPFAGLLLAAYLAGQALLVSDSGPGSLPAAAGPAAATVTAEPYDFARNCSEVVLEGGRVRQACCARREDEQLSCLPHLLVLGAPKAATTAIHAYLLLHPQVRAPVQKESHTFNDAKNFDWFINGKLNQWSFHSRLENEQRINIDSTPAYLNHLMGCQRLARYLPSTSKFVYVLREPVQRMWSYFVMDRRRIYVSRQRIVERFSTGDFQTLVRCLDLGDCTPNNITLSKPNTTAESLHSARLLFSYLNAKAENGSEYLPRCLRHKLALANCIGAQGIYGDFAPTTFWQERENVKADLASTLQGWRRELRNPSTLAARKRCDACSSPRAQRRLLPPLNVDYCIGCRCQCRSELEKSVLRHSLYRQQLEHCFEHLDRRRFLLLDYQHVIKDLPGTMERIIHHAELDDFSFSNVTNAMADEIFLKTYKAFKLGTAWASDSAPAWMTNFTLPNNLKRELLQFYKSDTEYLRRLTGLELTDWTS